MKGIIVCAATVACATLGCVFEGDGIDAAPEQAGRVQQAAAFDDSLWPKSDGAVQIRYRFDPYVSDQAFDIWTLNISRWAKLTRGRVAFVELPASTTPSGKWLELRSDHEKIGNCGLGAGSPTSCKIRDPSILGIGLAPALGFTVAIYADLGSTAGTKDDLQSGDGSSYAVVEPPNEPGTNRPLRIAALEFQSNGKLVTWFERDLKTAKSLGSYKIWRSTGTYPDLDSESGLTPVALPSGLDTVFSSTQTGSTLRGAALAGQTVYTFWNVGGQLKVARGSATDADAVEGLSAVSLPAGKTVADVIDMSFEGFFMNTWFVETYEHYGAGIRVPVSYRRYEGTYLDLDGAFDDPGVLGGDLKTSTPSTGLHELGHALGFIHEHQRSDRGNYLWIDPDAVPAKDYDVQDAAVKHTSFDFASVMLYSNRFVRRRDAARSGVPGNDSLSWRDVTGLCSAYDLPALSVVEAWQASADSDVPLGYSPLAGMADGDILGGDFTKERVFYAWYAFDGALKRSLGHEWDLSTSGSGSFGYPGIIAGEAAEILGMAIQREGNGSVYAWYRRSGSPACASGVYRSTGTSSNLSAYAAPACVSVFDSAHNADDIVEFAIDDYSGSDRVYTLYRDSTISVGSSTNLASIKPPTSYALPGGIVAADVFSFSLYGGTAMFHTTPYRLVRDRGFDEKF